MKDITQSRLASTLTLAVGAWVAASPAWIPMSSGAQINTLIIGAVVIVVSVIQLFVKNTVPSWISSIAAAWLLVSVFAFDMSGWAVLSAVVAGIATAALALWDGMELEHFAQRKHAAM